MGKLIPEFSYATLHIKLNITNLFKETNELCEASKQLEEKDIRKYVITLTNLNKIRLWMTKTVIQNLHKYRRENSYKRDKIMQVFKLK